MSPTFNMIRVRAAVVNDHLTIEAEAKDPFFAGCSELNGRDPKDAAVVLEARADAIRKFTAELDAAMSRERPWLAAAVEQTAGAVA